jgi:hypothetical protein
MRICALLLAVVFAASLPSVADAAKAKRSKAKPVAVAAQQADPNAAGMLVLTEGLPGLLMPTVLKPVWFHHQDQQKAAAAAAKGRRVR